MNTTVSLIREPLAGLTNGSSKGSFTAIDTPPIPRFCEGNILNWLPVAIGTVFSEISWARAVWAEKSKETL